MAFRAIREPVARNIEYIKRVIVAICFEVLTRWTEHWLHNVPEASKKHESSFTSKAMPELQEVQTLPGKFSHQI
jgi:hypothetical protein